MNGLPSMLYGDGLGKMTQVQFGGYNHTPSCAEGEIWDMENLTSDLYPILSPRKPRKRFWEADADVQALYAFDGRYYLIGKDAFCEYFPGGGRRVMLVSLSEGEKVCTAFGAYILLFPDKKYYNAKTGESGSLEAEWKGAAKIQDGTYAGEKAAANTIYAEGAEWEKIFRVGDAVEISGCAAHRENNVQIIVREIEGDALRFYENSFTVGEGGDAEAAITLRRNVPDMDFMCANENRVWGCHGDTIYASKPGDPFNWNVFDGISTDSFAADTGSFGDFTGCASLLGYPCFFKEEHVYKVYGDRAQNFQILGSATMGIQKGSEKSAAIAGEMLFYLSRGGVAVYTGGAPQLISAPFGTEKYKNAIGGSDGIKYYISMEDMQGKYHTFSYDTQKRTWHREDGERVLAFAWDGQRLIRLRADGAWYDGETDEEDGERFVESFAEFGDFTGGSPDKKGVAKLQMRAELSEGASLRVLAQFDSDGVWREVKTVRAEKKRSFYLPIIPRRCDHFRLRIEGVGMWKIYSITQEIYAGSEL